MMDGFLDNVGLGDALDYMGERFERGAKSVARTVAPAADTAADALIVTRSYMTDTACQTAEAVDAEVSYGFPQTRSCIADSFDPQQIYQRGSTLYNNPKYSVPIVMGVAGHSVAGHAATIGTYATVGAAHGGLVGGAIGVGFACVQNIAFEVGVNLRISAAAVDAAKRCEESILG